MESDLIQWLRSQQGAYGSVGGTATALRLGVTADTLERQYEAIKTIIPFVAEDFPNGPDGESCASPEYREAYEKLLKVLGRT